VPLATRNQFSGISLVEGVLDFAAPVAVTYDIACGEGPEFSTLVEIPAGQRLFFAVRAIGGGAFDERVAGPPSNIAEAIWVTPEELPPD
jgi:hypothetical protein